MAQDACVWRMTWYVYDACMLCDAWLDRCMTHDDLIHVSAYPCMTHHLIHIYDMSDTRVWRMTTWYISMSRPVSRIQVSLTCIRSSIRDCYRISVTCISASVRELYSLTCSLLVFIHVSGTCILLSIRDVYSFRYLWLVFFDVSVT